MSALLPKADIRQRDFHVRFGPEADMSKVWRQSKENPEDIARGCEIRQLKL
jgi:hypothetical protein